MKHLIIYVSFLDVFTANPSLNCANHPQPLDNPRLQEFGSVQTMGPPFCRESSLTTANKNKQTKTKFLN